MSCPREESWIRLVSLTHDKNGDLPSSFGTANIFKIYTIKQIAKSTKWADETWQTFLCRVCVLPPAAVASHG